MVSLEEFKNRLYIGGKQTSHLKHESEQREAQTEKKMILWIEIKERIWTVPLDQVIQST